MSVYTYVFWGLTFGDLELDDTPWEPEEDEEAMEELGVMEGYYCSEGMSLPFVAISDSFSQAKLGLPGTVQAREVQPDWQERLQDYCDRLGIPWSEPRWWLATYHEG